MVVGNKNITLGRSSGFSNLFTARGVQRTHGLYDGHAGTYCNSIGIRL